MPGMVKAKKIDAALMCGWLAFFVWDTTRAGEPEPSAVPPADLQA